MPPEGLDAAREPLASWNTRGASGGCCGWAASRLCAITRPHRAAHRAADRRTSARTSCCRRPARRGCPGSSRHRTLAAQGAQAAQESLDGRRRLAGEAGGSHRQHITCRGILWGCFSQGDCSGRMALLTDGLGHRPGHGPRMTCLREVDGGHVHRSSPSCVEVLPRYLLTYFEAASRMGRVAARICACCEARLMVAR